jgi:hypothetical protein
MSNSLLGSVSAASAIPAPSRPVIRNNMVQRQPQPSEPVSGVKTDAITQRRIEYLETQLKRLNTQLSELVSEKSHSTQVPTHLYIVYGTVAYDLKGTNGTSYAKKGEYVKLLYPMKKEGTKTLMKLELVDKVTAQIKHLWVVVFDVVDDVPKRFVTNFSASPPCYSEAQL